MHHHREGSGLPLVLIHGIGHHWQAWRPVIDRLAWEFDVVATDSPGFGQSPPLPTGVAPTVHAYADAFEAFFREQGLDRPHVAGNSMGGALALELANRGAASSATALSPAGFWTDGELRYAQTSLKLVHAMPRALRPGVLRLAKTGAGRSALFAQLLARPRETPADEAVATLRDLWASRVFPQVLDAFSAYRFTPAAGIDQARVTVAWGDKDRLLLYRRQSARAKAALPDARHVSLDAGHVPFHDAPDDVADVIRSTAKA